MRTDGNGNSGSRDRGAGPCRMPRATGPGVEAGGVAVEHGKALDLRSQPAKQRFYQRRHAANLALSRSIVLIARQSTRPRYSSFV